MVTQPSSGAIFCLFNKKSEWYYYFDIYQFFFLFLFYVRANISCKMNEITGAIYNMSWVLRIKQGTTLLFPEHRKHSFVREQSITPLLKRRSFSMSNGSTVSSIPLLTIRRHILPKQLFPSLESPLFFQIYESIHLLSHLNVPNFT